MHTRRRQPEPESHQTQPLCLFFHGRALFNVTAHSRCLIKINLNPTDTVNRYNIPSLNERRGSSVHSKRLKDLPVSVFRSWWLLADKKDFPM